MTTMGISNDTLHSLRASEQFETVNTVVDAPIPDQAAVTGSDEYVYGYTAPEGGVPAYISDSELVLWMQTKSQDIHQEVRELMGVSTERSKLMQDLTHLKGRIDSGAPAEEVVQEMDALRTAYAGTQFESEIAALCGDEAKRMIRNDAAAESIDHGTDLDDELAGNLEAAVDKLGRDDQIAFVKLNNLMSDLRETAQLAATIASDGHQTSAKIIDRM